MDAHQHLGPHTVRDLWLATLATPVRRTIVVQSRPSNAETRDLLALTHPLVAGVVGWADLTTVREIEPHPKLVGVRQGAQSEPDDWLCRPEVRRGLRAVAAAGLPFDLLVRARQLPAAIETVRAVPELTFVLNHLGQPLPGASSWPSHLRELAREPNVVAKLSGLPTQADWTTWTVADLRPWVEEAVAAFGPERLMFGSDWPVCLKAATYAQVHSTVDLLTARLTVSERADIFGGTASRVYRL